MCFSMLMVHFELPRGHNLFHQMPPDVPEAVLDFIFPHFLIVVGEEDVLSFIGKTNAN